MQYVLHDVCQGFRRRHAADSTSLEYKGCRAIGTFVGPYSMLKVESHMLGLLVPREPESDVLALLRSLEVIAIQLDGRGFADVTGGQFI